MIVEVGLARVIGELFVGTALVAGTDIRTLVDEVLLADDTSTLLVGIAFKTLDSILRRPYPALLINDWAYVG